MKQTFSPAPTTGHWRSHMGDTTVFINVDPVEERIDEGVRISVGFPVLAVTGWVKDPERFAARVAELLSEHFSNASASPSPTGDQVQ